MDFLRKSPQISWPTAGIIVFMAGYLSAAVTTLLFEDMLETVVTKLLLVGGNVIVFMTIAFIVSRMLKRTDIVDAAWGLAFIVAAISSYFVGSAAIELISIQTLVVTIVTIWGLRLTYAMVRRLIVNPEDKRYVLLRRKWRGNEMLNTYSRIFLVQAVLATTISITVIHVNISPSQAIGPLAIVGAIVWLIGFGFEAIGDWQLKQFLSNSKNKGKLMTGGLWKYTRHPNYFGEAVQWWGVFIIGLSTQYGWVGLIAPVAITYLLLFVSGIPMVEKSFEGKPGWKKYKQQTSKFLPLPQK